MSKQAKVTVPQKDPQSPGHDHNKTVPNDTMNNHENDADQDVEMQVATKEEENKEGGDSPDVTIVNGDTWNGN